MNMENVLPQGKEEIMEPNMNPNTPSPDERPAASAESAPNTVVPPAEQPAEPAFANPSAAQEQVPYGTQPNPAQQPYGTPGQIPYGVQPNPAQQPYGAQGQVPYGVQPNPAQQPYGTQGQVPYGVQPNPAQQPYSAQGQVPYNAQPYPYMAAQPPKKKHKAGKVVAIVVSVLVVLCILFGVGGYLLVRTTLSPQTQLTLYRESGDLGMLMEACDLYDTFLMKIDNKEDLQACFAEAVRDADSFYATFPSTSCVDVYDSAYDAYSMFMADYLTLMLQNGDYNNYVTVFTQKMLEYNYTDDHYYMSSATFTAYIERSYFTPTDEQAQVIVRGFDALIAASTSYEEMYLNLEEYYDCCIALGLQDQADAIAAQIEQFENLSTGWGAA